MAQFSVNTMRFDPYKNFKFRDQVRHQRQLRRGREQGERAQAHYRGGEAPRRRATRAPAASPRAAPEYEAITLERGVTHDVDFEQWANKVWNTWPGLGREVSLKDFRKDVIIERLQRGRPARDSLQGVPLLGCRSSRRSPDLDANANACVDSAFRSSRTKAGSGTTKWPSPPSSLSRSRRSPER